MSLSKSSLTELYKPKVVPIPSWLNNSAKREFTDFQSIEPSQDLSTHLNASISTIQSCSDSEGSTELTIPKEKQFVSPELGIINDSNNITYFQKYFNLIKDDRIEKKTHNSKLCVSSSRVVRDETCHKAHFDGSTLTEGNQHNIKNGQMQNIKLVKGKQEQGIRLNCKSSSTIWERTQIRKEIYEKRLTKKRTPNPEQFTFQPKLNEKSLSIAKSNLAPFTERLKYRVAMNKHMKKTYENPECTFTPKICTVSKNRKRSIHDIMQDHNRAKQKIVEMRQDLKENVMKNCPFKPNLRKHSHANTNSPPQLKEDYVTSSLIREPNEIYDSTLNEISFKNRREIDANPQNELLISSISSIGETSAIHNDVEASRSSFLDPNKKKHHKKLPLSTLTSNSGSHYKETPSKLKQALMNQKSYKDFIWEKKIKKEIKLQMLKEELERKEMEECSFKPEIREAPEWIHTISESLRILKSQIPDVKEKERPRWVNC